MNLQKLISQRRIVVTFSLACLLLLGNQLVNWQSFGSGFQIIGIEARGNNAKQNTILVWHWPFGNSFNLSGDFCRDKFGVRNCRMLDNQSRLSEADIVIFHNRELIQGDQKLPTHLKRNQNQRWVWLTMESPENNGDVKQFDGQFNWTMTYHRDADIYSPYGFMVPRERYSTEPLENFIPKNKTHVVCWIVSNFSPKHNRTRIYEKLKTVVPIELYGGSVNKRLDEDSLLPTISKCYFYLAFENSLFRDYVSEKLWRNAYQAGAVPVVYGPSREAYEAVAPKDSFIHVNDFSTVEALGKYLKDLVEDRERYAAYFTWRRKYTSETIHWVELACRFCPKINSMPRYKVYKDLDTWQH